MDFSLAIVEFGVAMVGPFPCEIHAGVHVSVESFVIGLFGRSAGYTCAVVYPLHCLAGIHDVGFKKLRVRTPVVQTVCLLHIAQEPFGITFFDDETGTAVALRDDRTLLLQHGDGIALLSSSDGCWYSGCPGTDNDDVYCNLADKLGNGVKLYQRILELVKRERTGKRIGTFRQRIGAFQEMLLLGEGVSLADELQPVSPTRPMLAAPKTVVLIKFLREILLLIVLFLQNS